MGRRTLAASRNKRILLLQGPVGPFFRRLATDLTAAGAQVVKVNFNGGDWLFYRHGAIAYRGGIEDWPGFVEDLMVRQRIDKVMLFGDCRAYHAIARAIAHRMRLEVDVFEEGYIRPDYVTLERNGVNGYSPLPSDPAHYIEETPAAPVRTDPVGNTFWHAAAWAGLYYLAACLLKAVFRGYRHHRPLTLREAGPWIRSVWRKAVYACKERGLQARLAGPLSGQYFLVPLQVHNDAQIRFHSGFASVEAFIRAVVASFARHAPDDAVLVVKHHPMDRGYNDYTALLRALGEESGLGQRLMYVHDLHLPSLLQHARGVVVVNSTVGLSALYHNTPVMACGDAIYKLQGLAHQGGLDDFWEAAASARVDAALFRRFRNHLINRTQLNGSFYKRLPIPGCATGMRWEDPPQPDAAPPAQGAAPAAGDWFPAAGSTIAAASD